VHHGSDATDSLGFRESPTEQLLQKSKTEIILALEEYAKFLNFDWENVLKRYKEGSFLED
jgi:hypothetical protein